MRAGMHSADVAPPCFFPANTLLSTNEHTRQSATADLATAKALQTKAAAQVEQLRRPAIAAQCDSIS